MVHLMTNVSVLWHNTSQWTRDVNLSAAFPGLSESPLYGCDDAMVLFESTDILTSLSLSFCGC